MSRRLAQQNSNEHFTRQNEQKGQVTTYAFPQELHVVFLSLWVPLPWVVFYHRQILSLRFHKKLGAYVAHSDQAQLSACICHGEHSPSVLETNNH